MLPTWSPASKSVARSGQSRALAAGLGGGCDSRADTLRPCAAGPYRRWNSGPTGQDCPVARSTATQTALAWISSVPAALRVVVRSAHRGPVAEQNVASRSHWPRRG